MVYDADWLKDVDPRVLPEPYREFVEIAGMANVLKIAERFQGTTVYFPKLDGQIKKIRDEKINKDFRGNNYKELAVKYGLTEVWVRQILSKEQDLDPTLLDFGFGNRLQK